MEQEHAARNVPLAPGVREPVPGRQGQCRICHEYGGDLIKPCRCDGSVKWVHRDCLNRWRASRTNPRSLTNCCECGSQYLLDLKRIISHEGEARRRRFVRWIAAQGVMSFGLVQVAIIALGAIIRLIDQKEQLVFFFNFPQNRGGLARNDFHNALLNHKTTYYVAGTITFLALLGLGGIVSGIVYLCTAGRGPVDHSVGTCNCDAWDMYFCADCCHSCSYSCSRCLTAPTSLDGECCCDCSRDCDCSQCNPGSANRDRDCWGLLVSVAVVILVILVLVGVFIAIAMVVVAVQRTLQQYAKLQQVRVLSEEYIVRDLADPEDLGDAESPASADAGAQQRMESGLPSASRQAFMVPDPEFQAKMQRMIAQDISAIFEGPDPRQALRDHATQCGTDAELAGQRS